MIRRLFARNWGWGPKPPDPPKPKGRLERWLSVPLPVPWEPHRPPAHWTAWLDDRDRVHPL